MVRRDESLDYGRPPMTPQGTEKMPLLYDPERVSITSEDSLGGRQTSKYQSLPQDTSPLGPCPPDTYNVAYIIMFIQGVGMLFPWNMFITATDYYQDRFDNSSYADNFELFFSFTFQASNIIMLFFTVRFQHLFSVSTRIFVPLFVQLAVFTLTTVLVKIDTIQVNTFFAITMACVVAAGMMTAFLQGGIFGLAGTLPFKYVQAVMGGQALGAIIVSVVSVITIAVGESKQTSALAFFSVSVAVIGVCIVSYGVMLRLPFIKYHLDLRPPESINKDIARSFSFAETFVKIRGLAVAVGYNFFITLALFPGITSSVESSNNFSSRLFVPIYNFLGFNIGDYIGRHAAGMFQRPGPKTLWIPIAIRTVFVPLFMFCNVKDSRFPTPFHHDAWPVIFMIIFAITNGYYGSLAMMYGPAQVSQHEKEVAGTMMVFGLTLGLGLGSISSFGVKAILTGHNPFVGNGSK
eukprot:Opistho-1_new@1037